MNWYVIGPFLLYIIANLVIGLYGQRILSATSKERFVEEYYTGGRSLGAVLLAFTLTGSLASAGTFIGTPALAYRDGFVWLVIASGQITAAFLMLGLLGKKFAIVARKVDAYTVPRVLAARFPHPLVGGGSAAIMVVFLVFYMSAQFIGGSLIFEALSGVPYVIGLTFMVFTTVVYTAIGGYRAVVLTEVMHGIVLLFGVAGLFFAVVAYAGGMTPLMQHLLQINPKLLTPDGAHKYSWPTIITTGWVLLGIALLGLPHGAMRALTYKDSRSMHRAMILSTLLMFLFTFTMMFVGVAANVVLGPHITVADKVVPSMIMKLFPPLLAGIVLAVPFSAIMSTVSSMLLVSANGLVGDLYVDATRHKLSNTARARLDKLTTTLLGGVIFLVALAPPPFLQTIVFYAIGGLASCFLVPLLFGLYWRRANTNGAIAAIVLGTVSYILIAKFAPNPLQLHSVTWSLALAASALVLVSLLTAEPGPEVIAKFWAGAKRVPEPELTPALAERSSHSRVVPVPGEQGA